jgi:hypothetical protein
MALESTTTSLNDGVYSAVIEPIYLGAAMDWEVAQQFFRRFTLVNKPGATIQIPRLDSAAGTVGSNATNLDTEFDATTATDLANTQRTTSNVQGTVSEYAFMTTVVDDVEEDTVNGTALLAKIKSDSAMVLSLAFEADCCALASSLSNGVGSTTVDPTIAVMLAAQVGIRKRGYQAMDGVVNIWDEQAVDDIEAAIIATSTSMATYAIAADKLLGIDRSANNGMGNGLVFNFRGYPVYSTGMMPTLNAGADVAAMTFVPSSPANDKFATFGVADKRPFRIEVQRDASLRATELVFSMRKACFEMTDGSGTLATCDA